jgi:hypothetical protein
MGLKLTNHLLLAPRLRVVSLCLTSIYLQGIVLIYIIKSRDNFTYVICTERLESNTLNSVGLIMSSNLIRNFINVFGDADYLNLQDVR